MFRFQEKLSTTHHEAPKRTYLPLKDELESKISQTIEKNDQNLMKTC